MIWSRGLDKPIQRKRHLQNLKQKRKNEIKKCFLHLQVLIDYFDLPFTSVRLYINVYIRAEERASEFPVSGNTFCSLQR